MGLTEDHPRALASGTILARLSENLLDLVFGDTVRADVRDACRGIEVEANFHVDDATTASGITCATRGGMSST